MVSLLLINLVQLVNNLFWCVCIFLWDESVVYGILLAVIWLWAARGARGPVAVIRRFVLVLLVGDNDWFDDWLRHEEATTLGPACPDHFVDEFRHPEIFGFLAIFLVF